GYYRTEDLDAEDAATVRVIWRRDDPENLEISAVHRRFEATEEWTRFELLLVAPEDATRAKVSLFNYFQPGVVWWSDVHARPAMTSDDEAVRRWAEEVSLMEGEPVTDGSNILPNPSFEIQAGQPDAPDFWERGGTGSEGYPVSSSAAPPDSVEMHHRTDGGRGGECSVAVECLSDAGRGAWLTRIPLDAGAWTFEAWYMTEGMDPEPRQGPVARISALDDRGRVILHFYAYGTASEDDWSNVTLDFDAPPGTVRAEVQLRNAWATGTVHWDDAHLGADVERRAELEDARAEDERLVDEAEGMLERARGRVEEIADEVGGAKGDLLVAALQWALQDAELAIEAGLGREALATLTDALDYCERAEEIVAEAELRPSDPERDGNPYVERLNAEMEGRADRESTYPKGFDGYLEIENSWQLRTVGADAHVAAWGLLDPRSDLQHDPRLLQRVFTYLQAVADHQIEGSVTPYRDSRDWNIDRFTLAPTLEALLLVEQHLPWTVLPSKREAWREALREMVEYQYRTYGFRWYEHSDERPHIYPNMCVHYLLLMELAYHIYDDERYPIERDRFVYLMDQGLLPMGGWTYTRMQNEVYGYHRLNTQLLARYYELSGDEYAREILHRSRPYYPLVHTPEAMVEHYTDVSWKHSWSGASPGGAEVKAGMFDCAENKRAALNALEHGGHEGGITAVRAVSWWKDVEPAPVRDDWLIYDANTMGPRGQFGRFSFAGTSRVAPGGGIGRDTFVGCMVSDSELGGRPLDAALQIATIQYQLHPGQPHWSNARYHSGSERHSVLVADEFASQAVRYRITRPSWGGAPNRKMPWEGLQQWFMSRDRLMGMLTIRPVDDTEAAGVWGRANFGLDREFEAGADDMLRYGSLIARIHDNNFAGIETAEAQDDPGVSPRSRELLLKDGRALSGEEAPWQYAEGEEHFYVIEVLPYWSELAQGIEAIREGAVRGVSFVEDDRRIMVLHNQQAEQTTFRRPAAGERVTVHSPPKDGEGPRARIEMHDGHFAWPPDEVRVPPSEVAVVDGQFDVTIPADSHVVVVSER
ncbi:MAG: hypothetical protein ACOC7J_03905, partial [Armatimonadota bacterium]